MKPIGEPSMDPRGVDWIRDLSLSILTKSSPTPLSDQNDELQDGDVTPPTVRREVAVITAR